jgi:hypothetical protein
LIIRSVAFRSYFFTNYRTFFILFILFNCIFYFHFQSQFSPKIFFLFTLFIAQLKYYHLFSRILRSQKLCFIRNNIFRLEFFNGFRKSFIRSINTFHKGICRPGVFTIISEREFPDKTVIFINLNILS